MKRMNVWLSAVVLVMACGGVEDGTEVDDATLEGASGPADSMVMSATRGEADDSVASAHEGGADKLGNGAVGSADASDGPSDDAPPADETTDRPADEAACTPDECGPGLLAPNVFCGDGSIGGPVCERDDAGKCGWDIRECPDGCTEDECGPQTLRAANILCSDGSMGGPVCARDENLACGWILRACPAECPADACGDAPDYLQICDDGTELGPVCTPDADPNLGAMSCSWKLPACP